LHDFTSKTSDIPESFHSLSVQLPLLTATLQRIQTQAEASRLPGDVTKALKAVVDNTSEQVSALWTSLSKTLPPAGASKLERALKALRSLAKEDKIQQALEKIHKNNDILVLHQTARHVDTGDRILEELSKLSVTTVSSKSFSAARYSPKRIHHPTFLFGRILTMYIEMSTMSSGDGAASRRNK
jgi:N-terminal domain on NACHT_NTPase and P-loop NTPases